MLTHEPPPGTPGSCRLDMRCRKHCASLPVPEGPALKLTVVHKVRPEVGLRGLSGQVVVARAVLLRQIVSRPKEEYAFEAPLLGESEQATDACEQATDPEEVSAWVLFEAGHAW